MDATQRIALLQQSLDTKKELVTVMRRRIEYLESVIELPKTYVVTGKKVIQLYPEKVISK